MSNDMQKYMTSTVKSFRKPYKHEVGLTWVELRGLLFKV